MQSSPMGEGFPDLLDNPLSQVHPTTKLTCRQATPMPTAPMSSRWSARNCSSFVMQPPCKVRAGDKGGPEAGEAGEGRAGRGTAVHPAEGRPEA